MDQQKPNQLPYLLEKYHQGLLSEEERALLDEWFEELGKHRIPAVLTENEKIALKSNLLEFIKKKSDTENLRTELRPKNSLSGQLPAAESTGAEPGSVPPPSIISSLQWVYRIAASLLLIALVGYGALTYYNYTVEQRYAIAITSSGDEVQKVLLSDGSIVWLKPSSSLQYPKNFRDEGDRLVSLQGEALFEVEKNPAQPFIVQSGQLTTTVLGTSFNIRTTEDNDIEVVVLTGKVSLTSATDKKGIIVLPEEKAVYNGLKKELAKIEIPVEHPVAHAIITGTEYDMNFSDTRMDEIIRRIEGKFDVKVTVSDPMLGNCVITADFTGQSLMRTLDIITRALTVEYELDNNRIALKGKGCD